MQHESTHRINVSAMSENILQTVVRDVIAPDVRGLKVRVSAQQEQAKVQFEALQSQIAGLIQQSETQYTALAAALGQNNVEAGPAMLRTISALSERVALLEASCH